jgi:hypothetical protein
MSGRIAIVDLTSGELSQRPGDTLTVDVPVDLAITSAVSVEDGRQGRYLAADGHGVVYGVVLRPLCWRVRGETCLVARSGGSKRRIRQFRLSRIQSISPG